MQTLIKRRVLTILSFMLILTICSAVAKPDSSSNLKMTVVSSNRDVCVDYCDAAYEVVSIKKLDVGIEADSFENPEIETEEKVEFKVGYIKRPTNVRNQPNLDSGVYEVFKTNTKIEYTTENEDWVRIYYGDGWGYIYKDQISDKKVEVNSNNNAVYSASQFKRAGVYNWGGYRWTWYSQNVLPGGGLKIPGRHVDNQGYVRDQDGYLCIASSSLAKGTVINTPFGSKGKVYDCGCAKGTCDVYVAW